MLVNSERLAELARQSEPMVVRGRVTQVVGLLIEATCSVNTVGSLCQIYPVTGAPVPAEVVGFRDNKTLLMPLGELRGIGSGSTVAVRRERATIGVGPALLGRVIDGLGRPLDDKGKLVTDEEYPIYALPRNPMTRVPIRESLDLGIRSINGLLTCGEGQRVAIMAGSGVGKSTLLGMMARYTEADVNVIALIGERGRELPEFIQKELQEDGLKKTVLVVATSDQPPLVRMRGAYIATAIAEYFESQGKKVLFMMDSVTRFAMAMREVGMAIGEPTTTKGYTPSVFSALPKLMERTGNFSKGSITGLYTVLVDGDDMNEPIADAVRSILDGHIVLSRKLADRSIYPPIDILASASRVRNDVTSRRHQEAANRFRELMAIYTEAEDMINLGAYKPGSNREIDESIRLRPAMLAYLKQMIDEGFDAQSSIDSLLQIVEQPVAGEVFER